MSIEPRLLDQALQTPESRDISDSPLVTALILTDPANVTLLVPFLEQYDTVQSMNARRILCLFGVDAAQYLIKALSNVSVNARKEGLEILWSMLLGENSWIIRDTLSQNEKFIQVLLEDKRPLPDNNPAYTERDFQGRICDLAYLVIQSLIDMEYDQSLFRPSNDDGRDEKIAILVRNGFGLNIA